MSQNDAFEVYRDQAGYYRWRLKASNHEIVASGEGYTSKQGAMAAVQAMPNWSSNTPVRDLT